MITALKVIYSQFMTTMEYLNQSLEDTRPVTYAPTRSAQLNEPPTETPIL